jgi:hypothetical protein
MKLRLRENSIRLRLLQSEVAHLWTNGIFSEEIRFNQFQTLTYTLKLSNEATEISAAFEDNAIIVEIPRGAARDWMETNLVGLESEQTIGKNLTLKITIEKDFVCLERPLDADNTDAFPHPKMNCAEEWYL